MPALKTAPVIALARRPSPPRFEIGDRVWLEPNGPEGLVVGVRYGAPAYDVRVNGTCLRNLPPDRIRLVNMTAPASVVQLRPVPAEDSSLLF